jgi:ADP-heptose:LPS heptosyltransferase
VQRTLALTTFLGAPPHGEETEFPLLPGDHAAAIVLLASAKPPLIGLHFGARERTKRWPLERFAAAGAALLSRYDGTLVILGASEDQQLARSLAETVNGSSLNLAGCMSLGTLGAVIARLALLITNDSGPAHIAYALRTPTITIFGGTDPARWGPPEDARHAVLACPVPCRPCDYAECPVGYVCLNGITVEQVVAAAEQVMP